METRHAGDENISAGVVMPFIITVNLKTKVKIIANNKFAVGPAIATKTEWSLGFLKLRIFTGTGFAQPNKNGNCVIIINNGRTKVPNGSACFKGFNVNLPNILAVGSPKRSAAAACAAS